jgi:hypothetical protein
MRLVVAGLVQDVQVSADMAKVSVTHPTECASGTVANVADCITLNDSSLQMARMLM